MLLRDLFAVLFALLLVDTDNGIPVGHSILGSIRSFPSGPYVGQGDPTEQAASLLCVLQLCHLFEVAWCTWLYLVPGDTETVQLLRTIDSFIPQLISILAVFYSVHLVCVLICLLLRF